MDDELVMESGIVLCVRDLQNKCSRMHFFQQHSQVQLYSCTECGSMYRRTGYFHSQTFSWSCRVSSSGGGGGGEASPPNTKASPQIDPDNNR